MARELAERLNINIDHCMKPDSKTILIDLPASTHEPSQRAYDCQVVSVELAASEAPPPTLDASPERTVTFNTAIKA